MAINERLIHTASESASGNGNQQEGMVMHLDAADDDSYDGSGTVWYDIKDHEYQPTTDVSEHFNTVTYTGNGSTGQSITGIGFQPDIVWIKNRDDSEHHTLFDSLSGADYTNYVNLALGQGVNEAFASFDTDGFTLDTDHNRQNANGDDYVAWCLKAGGAAVSNTDGSVTSQVSVNNDLGLSIVKYTTVTGAGLKVGHGMDVTPELVIWKRTDSSGDWFVYSSLFDGDYIRLNSANGKASGSSYSSIVSSTLLSSFSGTADQDFVVYCFASKRGVSKVGTYTGTGSTTKVYTGFEPAFVMTKRTDSSGDWVIHDNVRGGTKLLFPHLNNAESTYTATYNVEFNADGFSIGSGYSTSGGTYIYLAFAKNTKAADLTPSTDGEEIEKDLAVDSTKVYYSDSNYAIEQDGTVWRGNADNTGGTHEGEAYINNYFESGDTGKFYFEVESLGHTHGGVGFTDPTKYTASSGQGNTSFRNSQFYGLGANSYKYLGSTGSSFTTTIGTAGVILAVAIDVSTRKVWMGTVSSGTITWYSSGNPSTGANPFFTLPSSFSFYQPILTDLSYSSSARTGWHKLLREETASYLPTGFTYMKGAIKNADLELHLDPASYSGSGTTWTADVGNDATVVASRYDQELGDSFDISTDSESTIVIPSGHPLNDNSFTLEFWFRSTEDWNNSGKGHYFIYEGSAAGWNFFYYEGLGWRLSTPVSTGYFGNGTVITNKWHHVSLTYTGGTTKFYLDGELLKTHSATRSSSSLGSFDFGSTESAAYKPKCLVGQIRMYSTALTQDQVRQNFNFTKNKYPNGNNATGVSSSSFNTDGYFNVPVGNNNIAFPFNFKKDQTLVWWAKHGTKTTVDSASRYRYYMFDMKTATYSYWHARVDRHATNGYQFQLSWRQDASNYVFATDVIDTLVNQDDWNMYACYFTGTEGMYYSVNGGNWSSGTTTTNVGTTSTFPEGNFLLGKLWSNGSYYSNPNPYDVSDIKVFDKVLSSDELSSEYSKGQFGNN